MTKPCVNDFFVGIFGRFKNVNGLNQQKIESKTFYQFMFHFQEILTEYNVCIRTQPLDGAIRQPNTNLGSLIKDDCC